VPKISYGLAGWWCQGLAVGRSNSVEGVGKVKGFGPGLSVFKNTGGQGSVQGVLVGHSPRGITSGADGRGYVVGGGAEALR
jgi:hypothetical protein